MRFYKHRTSKMQGELSLNIYEQLKEEHHRNIQIPFKSADIQVSVIIPVYNEEKYLPQCLDSILRQTLQAFEVICIDDGSTDHSLEILYTYAKKDPRFKVLTQVNRYAGVARNLGMEHAKGKYLSFLDADDSFSPFLLERMYRAAEECESDIVMCNEYLYDSMTGKASKKMYWNEKELLSKKLRVFNRENVPEYLFQLTNGWAWDKLFRASFVRACNLVFSDTRVANDGFFVYIALSMADRITQIEDYLITHRINNMNSLSNTRKKSWYDGIQMLYDIKMGLEQTGLYIKLEKSFLNFALEYLVWAFEDLKDWKAKRAFHNCIQTECKEKFRFLQRDPSLFYNSNEYKTYEFIEKIDFEDYLIKKLENKNLEYEKLIRNVRQKIWPFPFKDVKKKSAIVLYGAGKVGQDYYWQIIVSDYCHVVLWMDWRFLTEEREYAIQGWLDELDQQEFDKVVIALLRKEDAEEAIALLKERGIAERKIVWRTGTGEDSCL